MDGWEEGTGERRETQREKKRRETCSQSDRQIHTKRQRDTETKTFKETEIWREKGTQRNIERDRETETDYEPFYIIF